MTGASNNLPKGNDISVGAEVIEREVTIQNRYGLHARPAAMFVSACNRFQSEIQVVKGGTTVNGKNILEIMTLGAAQGTKLILKISGDDASDAATELITMIEGNFGE